ncbi:hypothetical protein BHE74_00057460 [Ensete ventricosum]|nr:hypothetical protein GW17_00024808 [Ensete ventricosum]RWW37429.1 hypothetical protein BHE74_00057460 [Ensete ventricosum]
MVSEPRKNSEEGGWPWLAARGPRARSAAASTQGRLPTARPQGMVASDQATRGYPRRNRMGLLPAGAATPAATRSAIACAGAAVAT